MAKGAEAKELVVNKIKETFGNDFIDIVDKKLYVWSEENGERMQVALSLTCPKVPIEVDGTPREVSENSESTEKVEVTEEDKAKVADLMKILGI